MDDKNKADNSDAKGLLGTESAAMQWLAAARNLDELDDSTLQEYIDAVGGVRVWNELMALSMYTGDESESAVTSETLLGFTAGDGIRTDTGQESRKPIPLILSPDGASFAIPLSFSLSEDETELLVCLEPIHKPDWLPSFMLELKLETGDVVVGTQAIRGAERIRISVVKLESKEIKLLDDDLGIDFRVGTAITIGEMEPGSKSVSFESLELSVEFLASDGESMGELIYVPKGW